MKNAVWLALSLALTSCGSSPAAPSAGSTTAITTAVPGGIDASGNYTGTLDSNYPRIDITATITQTGASITGSWKETPPGASGSFTGTIGIHDNGAIIVTSGTISFKTATGPTCSGQLNGQLFTTPPEAILGTIGFTVGDCGMTPRGNLVGVALRLFRQ